MSLSNTRQAYGWAAIALHWIAAVGVIALYLLGEQAEEAATRAERAAALQTHVSVGVLLFAFLAARIFVSLAHPHPRPLERNRGLRLASRTVHALLLFIIAVLLVSGPLAIWSTGEPLRVFDWFAIPSPFPIRVDWVQEAAEIPHKLVTNLFWPLLILHVAGALKHLLWDRDATVQRMLWVRRGG